MSHVTSQQKLSTRSARGPSVVAIGFSSSGMLHTHFHSKTISSRNTPRRDVLIEEL